MGGFVINVATPSSIFAHSLSAQAESKVLASLVKTQIADENLSK